MTHLGLTLNLGGSISPEPPTPPTPSLFLTFTSTLVSLSGDQPLETVAALTPTFTITSTPSPINIKYALTFGTGPFITKIQYSKNGRAFVNATLNTNFADTFVNGDTLEIRVQGTGYGNDLYIFVLKDGSSTTISNEVQVVASFEF